MPLCVGLTGGIGSGKSVAARMFEEFGAAVVDTDAIAHELTRPGGRAVPAIRKSFGAEYIAAHGGLDRARMRRLVFRNAGAKGRLEAILHPLIRRRSRACIAAARRPYVVIVVPLLLETGSYRDLVDRILVVDCDEQRQIARTMARSGLAKEEVLSIMAAQLPRARRLAQADDMLLNDGGMDALRRRARKLHAGYLALARRRRSPAATIKPAKPLK